MDNFWRKLLEVMFKNLSKIGVLPEVNNLENSNLSLKNSEEIDAPEINFPEGLWGSIRKCCPQGSLYSMLNRNCSPINDTEWTPQDYNYKALNVIRENISLVFGFPSCPSYFQMRSSNENPNHDIYLLENGDLYVEKYNMAYPNPLYCIDYFRYTNFSKEEVLLCFPNERTLTLCEKMHTLCIPVFVIISTVFLSFTLIVYALLPHLNSNINGKCVMSSTIALIMAFTCLVVKNWVAKDLTLKSCQFLGLCSQYFSLASFFWLNVLAFDLWRTLRATNHATSRDATRPGRRRFGGYSVYAWGTPFLISGATACAQFLVPEHREDTFLSPGFGVTGCFFPQNDLRPSWLYFYGFITALMVANGAFFLHLLYILQGHQRTQTIVRANNRPPNKWVGLYLKLFCIMGISWLLEVGSLVEGTCEIWIWMDSLNSLRGVFIFVIFVCKSNVIRKLKTTVCQSVKKRSRRLMKSCLGSSGSKQTPWNHELKCVNLKAPGPRGNPDKSHPSSYEKTTEYFPSDVNASG